MQGPITPDVLDALRKISTPTISNAIESFNVRPRNQGFMSPDIRCIFRDLGVMVGFAATATMRADQPPTGHYTQRWDWWDETLKVPAPRVVVVQDLDQPTCVGALWGEVNANTHKALGCIGVVTNGGVRDLDEVHALGFHLFAAQVIVSHAYVHIVDAGVPVKVGGVIVKPGDIIHGDKHGVITIPAEIAKDVARAAAEVEQRERRTIAFCQSREFTVEGLKVLAQGRR